MLGRPPQPTPESVSNAEEPAGACETAVELEPLRALGDDGTLTANSDPWTPNDPPSLGPQTEDRAVFTPGHTTSSHSPSCFVGGTHAHLP